MTMDIKVPDHIENPAAYRRAVERKIANRRYEAAAKKKAAAMLAWFTEDETRIALTRRLDDMTAELRCSDFHRSLMAAFDKWGYLTERQEAALRASFERAEARAAERLAENAEVALVSRYVGVVGNRAEFRLTLKRRWTFTGMYGECTGHILADDDGNQFVLMGTAMDMEVGETRLVKATIKGHGVRDGVKQTTINRAKVDVVRPSDDEFLAGRFTAGAKGIKLG